MSSYYPDMFWKPAHSMSDNELEREIKSINTGEFKKVLNDNEVTDSMKQSIIEHMRDVEQEKQRRDNGEWVIPLYEFGLFDF